MTIRLYEPYESMFQKLFEQPNPACQEAVLCFLDLRVQSVRELRGLFTRAELTALVDMYNGTMFDSRFAVQKQTLLAQIEDSELYNKISDRWKINISTLVLKVESMSTNQAFFWVYEIHRFWDEPAAYGSPSPDLEKFLNEYTSE